MSGRTGYRRDELRCPGCRATVGTLRDRHWLKLSAGTTASYDGGALTVACGACGAMRVLGDLWLDVGEGVVLGVGKQSVW